MRRIRELLGHKNIVSTERYSHLGTHGLRTYNVELARAMAGDTVGGLATPFSAQAPHPEAIGARPAENLVINSLINRVSVAGADSLQFVKPLGGGGATRTPDLGIMSPFRLHFEQMRNVYNDFDFEEDTLP